MRIGVNWGSLDPALLTELMDENAQLDSPLDAEAVQQEAMVQSALRSAAQAEEIGLPHDAIVLSCKMSRVPLVVQVYTELARRCDYPLHLGLTEAGMGTRAIVSTSAALALLLQRGIGDTLRVSLTPEPDGERTEREPPRRHRNQPARLQRKPERTGVHRRRAGLFPERRPYRRGIPGHALRLRGKEIHVRMILETEHVPPALS